VAGGDGGGIVGSGGVWVWVYHSGVVARNPRERGTPTQNIVPYKPMT
jgi:hypothetical protein